jgi:transposase
MSISILYHTQNIIGYTYERTFYTEGVCIFRIRPQERLLRCPICGSFEVQSRGHVQREIMLLPTGRRKNYAQVDIPRVYCFKCDKLRQIRLGFVEENNSCSKLLERYICDLCKLMTIKDVAQHLGISWSTVKDIHKRHLEGKYGIPSVKNLHKIAIDEISCGKGHKYLTIVLNLENGAVVFVGTGKGAEALAPFWKRLGWRKKKIQSVAIDMSPAYTKAVRENLPKATLVYDHFHVIKLYNEKLSEFRRALYHETKDADMKELLKGTRWLLLKNRENLNEEKKEWNRLEAALSANRPLMIAYYLKEELHWIWEQADLNRGAEVFDEWLKMAEMSGVGMLIRFAKTLRDHREGILNYYKSRITTAALEGTNTKIRVLQKRAYGYRDQEYLKLRILALHESNFQKII